MNELFELIRSDNTLYANRTLARAIGLNEAIIFAALLSKEHYYHSAGQLDEEGMFYSTSEDLEESTTLTRRQQAAAIENLTKMNLITTKLKGAPPKKHFKINKDMSVMEEILSRGKIKRTEKTEKQSTEYEENGNEINFDILSKSNLTECQNQIEQNVEQNLSNKTYINIYNNTRTSASNPVENSANVEKSVDNFVEKPPNKNRLSFGDFSNVKMTDEEYQELTKRFGKTLVDTKIDCFDMKLENKILKYQIHIDHYSTLWYWCKTDVKENDPDVNSRIIERPFNKDDFFREVAEMKMKAEREGIT